MRGSDGKLCLCEMEGDNVWQDCIEKIMNEQNDWDYNLERDVIESPVDCVSCDEVV